MADHMDANQSLAERLLYQSNPLLCFEAAAALTAQAEEIERLTAKLAQWEGDGIETDAKIAAAEQQNEALRKALDFFTRMHDETAAHSAALRAIEYLAAIDPDATTPEGVLLSELAAAVEKYEISVTPAPPSQQGGSK